MPRRPDDILPPDKRDTLTIQLDRIGDENLRDWIAEELLLAKRAGVIPRSWGMSLLIKAMIRGQYQPFKPAPRASEPPKGRRKKSDK